MKIQIKPQTKTSNLGKPRYTSYVRPEDVISRSKELLKNVSPRLRSTLEYMEREKNPTKLSTRRNLSILHQDCKRQSVGKISAINTDALT